MVQVVQEAHERHIQQMQEEMKELKQLLAVQTKQGAQRPEVGVHHVSVVQEQVRARAVSTAVQCVSVLLLLQRMLNCVQNWCFGATVRRWVGRPQPKDFEWDLLPPGLSPRPPIPGTSYTSAGCTTAATYLSYLRAIITLVPLPLLTSEMDFAPDAPTPRHVQCTQYLRCWPRMLPQLPRGLALLY